MNDVLQVRRFSTIFPLQVNVKCLPDSQKHSGVDYKPQSYLEPTHLSTWKRRSSEKHGVLNCRRPYPLHGPWSFPALSTSRPPLHASHAGSSYYLSVVLMCSDNLQPFMPHLFHPSISCSSSTGCHQCTVTSSQPSRTPTSSLLTDCYLHVPSRELTPGSDIFSPRTAWQRLWPLHGLQEARQGVALYMTGCSCLTISVLQLLCVSLLTAS